MNYNKNGISAVVATVLIILITVAAVTIIWAAIIPMITSSIDEGTQCLDATSQVQIVDRGFTCFQESVGGGNPNVSVQISHGSSDFELAAVQVIVSQGGNTETYELLADNLATGSQSLPGPNEEKVFVVDYLDSDDNIITGVPDSVQIAPYVQVGNSREVCPATGSVQLRACN